MGALEKQIASAEKRWNDTRQKLKNVYQERPERDQWKPRARDQRERDHIFGLQSEDQRKEIIAAIFENEAAFTDYSELVLRQLERDLLRTKNHFTVTRREGIYGWAFAIVMGLLVAGGARIETILANGFIGLAILMIALRGLDRENTRTAEELAQPIKDQRSLVQELNSAPTLFTERERRTGVRESLHDAELESYIANRNN